MQQRIRIEPSVFGVGINLVSCRFLGRAAFVMRTDRNEAGTGHHPRTVVEIVSDVRLRDAFGLGDGDAVEIAVGDGQGAPVVSSA